MGNHNKLSTKDPQHHHAQVSTLTDMILTGAFFILIAATVLIFATKYNDGNDLLWFFVGCVGVLAAIRFTDFVTNTLFRDIISRHILNTGPVPHPLLPGSTVTKFTATLWQFVIHFVATICEAYILWDEPWLSNPYTCFIPVEYKPNTGLRLFYIFQLAIWIMTCFSHRFNSDAHAHKDYLMMYVHHLATIALVAMSYWSGLTRIGLIILFIHDCSDIGIDLLKLSNYLSIDGPRNFFLVEVSYACAIVMWVYFRLWYFPVYIIYYGVVGALGYIGPSVHGHVPAIETISGPYRDQIMIVVACGVFLLTLLFCMHVFWFFLLIRILVRMICESDRKKIGNDEYEGDHGDVAHGDTTDKHIAHSSRKTRSKGGKKSD